MKHSLILFTTVILFSCGSKSQSKTRAQTDTLLVSSHSGLLKTEDPLAKGTFVNTDAHQLSGDVYVYQNSEGNIVLIIDNLSVLGGPDVDVFLSDTNGYANVIRLGHLDGEDGQPIKGVLGYTLSPGTDLKKYNHVIFWCKRYSVLFGYAKLN